jgi:DNA processing protein
MGAPVSVSKGRPKGVARYKPPAETVTLETEKAGLFDDDKEFRLEFSYLYVAGDLSLLKRPAIAIVGSRGASELGRKRAAQLARALAQRDVVVMSGLAEGIDYAAHEAALVYGGRTIAVVGTPLERAYPAKHGPMQEVIYRDHLLVSPFRPGMRTFPSHFPDRNRVMARLALATVVIEAGETSGSIHQVAESVRVGRPVLFARSMVENPEITWPKRFLDGKGAVVFDRAEEVLAVALGEKHEGTAGDPRPGSRDLLLQRPR